MDYESEKRLWCRGNGDYACEGVGLNHAGHVACGFYTKNARRGEKFSGWPMGFSYFPDLFSSQQKKIAVVL